MPTKLYGTGLTFDGSIGVSAQYQTPATWPQVNRYSYSVSATYQAFYFRPDLAQFSKTINPDYNEMLSQDSSDDVDTEWDYNDRTITKVEVIADTYGPDKPWGTEQAYGEVRYPGRRSDESKIGWYVGPTRPAADTLWGLAAVDHYYPYNPGDPEYEPFQVIDSFVTGPAGPQSLATTDVRITGLEGSQLADTAWRTLSDDLLQDAYAAGEAEPNTTVSVGLRFTGVEERIMDGSMKPEVHGSGWDQDPFMYPSPTGSPQPGRRPLSDGTFLLITDYSSAYYRPYNGLAMRFTVRHRRRRLIHFVLAGPPAPEVIEGAFDLSRRIFT